MATSFSHSYTAAISFISLLILFVVCKVRRRKSHPFPPGPPGEFLVGHLRVIPFSDSPTAYLNWGKEYRKNHNSMSLILILTISQKLMCCTSIHSVNLLWCWIVWKHVKTYLIKEDPIMLTDRNLCSWNCEYVGSFWPETISWWFNISDCNNIDWDGEWPWLGCDGVPRCSSIAKSFKDHLLIPNSINISPCSFENVVVLLKAWCKIHQSGSWSWRGWPSQLWRI